ncbi:hypothetical protein EGM87_13730 [Sphingobium sp. RSMS]|uniref:hypothetical protein n=1 Tax=Sphingobium sp. RSMS TaxID=520734 RepID=UPI0010F4FA5B|nr:hypothetical protein [Sphingobium sp. RSMS]UXC90102.1 hypothetical protein EGM87_13730 [Sphingobium sp. RSMS]
MRRRDIIHAATCRCDSCRSLAERFAEASLRTRALFAAGAIVVGIILSIFGPLIAAAISN